MIDSRTITGIPILLSPQDVAEILRVSVATIYRLVEKREIRFYKVRGSLRFNQIDVINFLNGHCVESIKEII
jgi:excisionase family DNA binding protein